VDNDSRVKRLRELIEEAKAMQRDASQLVADLTDQLERSILNHPNLGVSNDRPARRRRNKPRD